MTEANCNIKRERSDDRVILRRSNPKTEFTWRSSDPRTEVIQRRNMIDTTEKKERAYDEFVLVSIKQRLITAVTGDLICWIPRLITAVSNEG